MPGHDPQSGKSPPFTLYRDGGFKCFGCDAKGGDGISLYAQAKGLDWRLDFPRIVEELGPYFGATIPKPQPAADPAGRWTPSAEPPAELTHKTHGAPSHAWRVLDADGRLFALHCRFETAGGKAFAWWRNGQWTLGGLKIPSAPLYGAELLSGWDQDTAVFLTEGERAADSLRARALQAVATVCGSGTTPRAKVLAALGGWRGPVILWPDFDDPGRSHMEKVRSALPPGLDVRTFVPPDLSPKGDAVEWLAARAAGVPAAGLLAEILEGAAKCGPAEKPSEAGPDAAHEISIALGDLSRKIIPTREDVLRGVLKVGDVSCISGQPGRGKSLVAVAAAIAVASGRNFAGLAVPRARSVVYIDGELLESEVKERSTKLAVGMGLTQKDIAGLPLQFIIELAQAEESPKLNTQEGRTRIERYLERYPEIEVVFLDSLRILFGLGDENKSESWTPVNDFLLTLKRRGLSVVCIHHNSRQDTFNGHLAGATAFSQIVNLSARAEREDDAEVTALDWSYSKARSLTGAEKVPFGMKLESEPDGRLYWTRCDASAAKKAKRRREDPRRARFLALLASGATMRSACKQVGCSTSTGWKWKQSEGER